MNISASIRQAPSKLAGLTTFRRLLLLIDPRVAFIFLVSSHAFAATGTIDNNTTYQTISGFGASISGGSDIRIPVYTDPQFLDFVAHDLGMSILRMQLEPDISPVEIANPEDIHYEDFVIAEGGGKGAAVTIQFARELIERDPDFKVIATAWSPPGWMKENGKANGTQSGFLLTTNRGYDDDNRLRDDRYAHYAKWLFEYQQLLEVTGTPLYAMSPQNELMFTQYFDSCMYTGEEYARIVRETGKRFELENVQRPLIFGPEDMTLAQYQPGGNSRHNPYVNNLMDAGTAKYFDVWATHGYSDGVNAGNAMDPEKYWDSIKQFNRPYWITEGGTGEHDWPTPVTNGIANYLHHALTGGNASAFVAWQLMDPEPSTHSVMGWDYATKKTYAAMHFWRFIRPGFQRVEAEVTGLDGRDLLISAFKDPDSRKLTIVVINKGNVARNFDLILDTGYPEQTVDIFQTSLDQDFAHLGNLPLTDNQIYQKLPGYSITTYAVLEPVYDFSLDLSNLEVEVDIPRRLHATFSPSSASNRRIFWSSSNPDVAAVNGTGWVTGRSVGSATITAMSEDGGITKEVQVTVQPRAEWTWAEWTAHYGYINTGEDFIGSLYHAYNTNWIYSFGSQTWIYLPVNSINPDYAWAWFTVEDGASTSRNLKMKEFSSSYPQTAAAGHLNIAVNKSITVDGSSGEAVGEHLIDGNTSTEPYSRWSVETYPQHVLIDLEGVFDISEFRLYPLEGRSYQYTVEASIDGVNYEPVADRSNNSGSSTVWTNSFTASARFIRVIITGGGSYGGTWVSIGEMEVYGAETTAQVSGISLSHGEIIRGVGQSWRLQADISPWYAANQNMTWTSSDPTVASVDETGVVTALREGISTVTVTSDDGGHSDQATIQVVTDPLWGKWPQLGNGIVDTGTFTGYLYVNEDSDWVYSYGLTRWILIPEESISEYGAWGLIYRNQ